MGDLVLAQTLYTSDSTNIELFSRFLTIRPVKILPHAFESDGLHSQPSANTGETAFVGICLEARDYACSFTD